MCAGYITACRISVHLFTSYSLIAAVGLAEDNAVVISAGILFSPLQVYVLTATHVNFVFNHQMCTLYFY